ncbi:MAG: hypothetical protein ACR2HR_07250 [Euzebya sp.]
MRSRNVEQQIVGVLDEIEALLPSTVEEWRADRIRQLAAERLWILAGNLA